MALTKSEKNKLKWLRFEPTEIDHLDRQTPGATFNIVRSKINEAEHRGYEKGYHQAIEDMKEIVNRREE